MRAGTCAGPELPRATRGRWHRRPTRRSRAVPVRVRHGKAARTLDHRAGEHIPGVGVGDSPAWRPERIAVVDRPLHLFQRGPTMRGVREHGIHIASPFSLREVEEPSGMRECLAHRDRIGLVSVRSEGLGELVVEALRDRPVDVDLALLGEPQGGGGSEGLGVAGQPERSVGAQRCARLSPATNVSSTPAPGASTCTTTPWSVGYSVTISSIAACTASVPVCAGAVVDAATRVDRRRSRSVIVGSTRQCTRRSRQRGTP